MSVLPLMTLFHLVMWYGFTRTLFRPETGDLKRIGYLVGVEDRKALLQAEEPHSGYSVIGAEKLATTPQVSTIIFGDSFAASLAKARSLQTGQPVGLAPVNWEKANGLAQIKSWLADDWFRAHGVKTIIVERVEYAWLNTFADEGDPSLNISWQTELSGDTPAPYEKASRWTFANNGNFKVVLDNLAYCFSPTAFKMTDTSIAHLQRKFFSGTPGDRLLFYRGDVHGALTSDNQPRLEQALRHLQELAELCHRQGLAFHLIVPPVKSYLYYDWVERPFYPDSKMLETLQTRATSSGYVDLKQLFHRQLEAGFQDLYYPDDAHWNFPAAQLAAEELAKAEAATP